MKIKQINIPPINEKTIYITGSCISWTGYDAITAEIAQIFKDLNLDVRINSSCSITSRAPSWFSSVYMPKPHAAWEIMIMPPPYLGHYSISKRTIIFSMWESDELNSEWIRHLNKSKFVCVPSQWCHDLFKKSGVTVPIFIVPLGYDDKVYKYCDEYPELFTFGSAAALTGGGFRKNMETLPEVFKEAFPNEKDVRLKIKITPNCPDLIFDDPRIKVTKEFLDFSQLADWYKSISVFVNTSSSEGFGLHLIESMATGRPLISTDYSSVGDYFDESAGWKIDYDLVPAEQYYLGKWSKPIKKSLVEQMRNAYNQKNLLTEKGVNAKNIASRYTWGLFGTRFLRTLANNGIINAT